MQTLSAPPGPPGLPDGILVPLRRFRRRLALARGGAGLGLAALAGGALLGVSLLLDRFLILDGLERSLLTWGTLSITGLLLAAALFRALRPRRKLELARAIEALSPDLDEGLISAVQIGLAPPAEQRLFAPGLVRALLDSVAARLEALRPEQLVDARGARRLLLAAGLAWSAVGASAALHGESFALLAARFIHPGRDLPRPSSVHLDVSPGSVRSARGEDVAVTAVIARGSPAEVVMSARGEDGTWSVVGRSEPSPGASPSCRHVFRAPGASFEYRVRAGDFESPAFRVDVRDPPRPLSFTFTYTYPPYSRRPRDTVTRAGGSIAAVSGSKIDIDVRGSEPLRAAGFRRGDEPERSFEVMGDRARIAGVDVSSAGSWSLVLEGLDGVRADGRERYAIQPSTDRPPSVEVLEPRPAEVVVEELGFIDVRAEAADDLGLSALELVFARPEGPDAPPPPVPLLETAAGGGESERPLPRAAETLKRIDASGLGLEPGEAITFFLRARDELGQESASAERSVRMASIPPPPEGPGWPESLAGAEAAIALAAAEWSALLPEAREPVDSFEADPARAERLSRAAEDSLAVLSLIRSTSVRLAEMARSMTGPTPNRTALEDAARLLARVAEEDGGDFWAAAMELAGRTRTIAGGRVPAGELFKAHRGAGEKMDTVLSGVRAILRSERLDGAAAGAALLLHDARALMSLRGRDPGSAGGADRRSKAIIRDAVSLAALLAGASGPREGSRRPGTEGVEATIGTGLIEAATALARAMESKTLPPTDGGIEAAVGSISAASLRIEELRAREEKRAVLARPRLASESALGPALAELSAELRSPPPPGSAAPRGILPARRAFRALREEIAALGLLGRTDIDAEMELQAMEELLERAALDALDGPATPDAPGGNAAGLVDEILAAHRATEPARKAGRAAADLERIASGEEDIAARLRAARAGNARSTIAISRRQAKARAALEDARLSLGRAASAFPSGLDRPLEGVQSAARSIDESRRLIEDALRAGGDATLGPAADAALAAASALDGAIAEIDRARADDLPDAAAARARLISLVGTLPRRIARLAGDVRAHAALLREPPGAGGGDPAVRARGQLSRTEELRSDAERLAAAARRESERLGRAGASRSRVELHDRAALRLAAIASGELAAAARALAGEGGPGAPAAGAPGEAADLEERAAAGLEELARAFSALEAGEAIRDAASSIEGAMEPAEDGPPDGPAEPAAIARDARRLLAAALRASESIASRLGDDPRKPALLEVLRSAADHFRRAAAEAERSEAQAAASSLEAGRAELDRAIAMIRGLREENRPAEERAEGTLARLEEDARAGETSRELKAAYAELEKLMEIRELDAAVAEAIDSMLGKEESGGARDEEALRDLAREADEAAEELDERFMSAAELVELVAKLLELDRDGREAEASARSLALEAERGGGAPADPRRDAFKEEVRRLVQDFRAAGFKISSVLPPVIRAYWKATEAADPLLHASEEAVRSPRALAGAAEKLGAFLDRVDDLRREALEAIADLERGSGAEAAAQAGLERARRSMREASRLLREGKLGQASRAGKESGLSLAEAASAMRARIADVLLPRGAEGSLASRVLDEEAARLGLAWDVRSRGDEALGDGEIGRRPPGEMPYPSEFRELIRIYMKALSERDRR